MRDFVTIRFVSSMIAFAITIWLVSACTTTPPNPAFPTHAQAQATLKLMEATPITPSHPILILGGYMDPGFAAASLEKAVRAGTSPSAEIVAVSFGDCTSFTQCRNRTLRAMAPWKDREVDVIANSMGGLVARFSAMDASQIEECGRRAATNDPPLRIHTLFTLSSPHLGAVMAEIGASSVLTLDMRQGSKFLACLDHALATATYELVCYGRTNDSIVGMDRCAPEGHELRWVATPRFEFGHIGANKDPRILADMLAAIRASNVPSP